MSQTRIEKLTPEQEALIPVIRDEWIKIALDTSPTDKQKAEDAILWVYANFNACVKRNFKLIFPQQILWFDNPVAAVEWMTANQSILQEGFSCESLFGALGKEIIYQYIKDSVEFKVGQILFSEELNDISITFSNIILMDAWNAFDEKFIDNNRSLIENYIYDAIGIHELENLAFYAYFHTIGVDCSKVKGLWDTAKHCGFWWAFRDIAVATPKPSAIRLDTESRLHAEGEPAVAYKGFNIYAYHGVRLPEKYGQLHPSQWQAQWLLTEDNAELRRVLIQGIGYEKIARELQAVELDTWREYTLLEIDNQVDIEPICLLKMTCPSTGHIHILRVPPNMTSAREAVCWVNWGVDPENFSVQT